MNYQNNLNYIREGDNINIGKNVKIGYGTIIFDNVSIRDGVIIHPYAVIGNIPQHTTKGKNPYGKVIIGEGSIIREFVTIHSPMDEKITEIGKNCYIMATAHIGHDCILGNNVVLSNSVNLSGHTRIGKNVTIGLNATTHQYITIGDFAMIGMNTPVNCDIIPYTVAYGNPSRWYKMNRVGLLRFAHADSKAIIEIEKILSWGKQYLNPFPLDKNFFDGDIVELGKISKIPDVKKAFLWFDKNRNRGNRKITKYDGEIGSNLRYVV